MRLYIVRHAETEGPDLCKFQNPRTPLSSNGNKQAKFLALRFADLSIDCILSSPHLRALQTAEAISESKSLPIISSTLISGIRHPSAVTDRYKNDPEVVRIMMEVEANFLNESSAKFDEETFDDLISRAREALDFFLSLGKESILIVTHGNYVKLILALMMFQDRLTSKQLHRIWSFYKTYNTGVTVCEYDHSAGWSLVCYNDYSMAEGVGV